jgi:hypothetical protein
MIGYGSAYATRIRPTVRRTLRLRETDVDALPTSA